MIDIERYKTLNVQGDVFAKIGIFARNTIRLPVVFTATTNNTGENGDKKQNTLPYTLQVKVVEVCLVGAGDESRTRREQLGKLPPYR